MLTKNVLVADMIELTRQYGRYGYRRIAALLRDAGWHVNDKRVEILWRREGLKVPMKQPKKRAALAERRIMCPVADQSIVIMSGAMTSCIAEPMTEEAFRTLNIMDEYSPESAWQSGSIAKLNSGDVIDALT